MNTTITTGMQQVLDLVRNYNESGEPCVIADVALDLNITKEQVKGFVGALVKADLMMSEAPGAKGQEYQSELYAK